ncbi:unnamed protein product [Ceratitis capitata]|uniref:(Mediterranean fruit fly) hypothetical protein n=1 Tax=Ceratitis capitata TaxID=7213 RepID=A0A811U9F9_CERCA|nr:unnamed protein product [Ceratitis capitata]
MINRRATRNEDERQRWQRSIGNVVVIVTILTLGIAACTSFFLLNGTNCSVNDGCEDKEDDGDCCGCD